MKPSSMYLGTVAFGRLPLTCSRKISPQPSADAESLPAAAPAGGAGGARGGRQGSPFSVAGWPPRQLPRVPRVLCDTLHLYTVGNPSPLEGRNSTNKRNGYFVRSLPAAVDRCGSRRRVAGSFVFA